MPGFKGFSICANPDKTAYRWVSWLGFERLYRVFGSPKTRYKGGTYRFLSARRGVISDISKLISDMGSWAEARDAAEATIAPTDGKSWGWSSTWARDLWDKVASE